MTSHVMDTVLKKFSVVQFDPQGHKFDPNMHEAIYNVDDASKDHNTVASVMQTGWKIGDRCLRPAKVAIVKKK